MHDMTRASSAYAAASGHRSLREQEADVFRRVVGMLRAAQAAGPVLRAKALADNRRLWTTVHDLMQDPENALPIKLRAAIVSVGLAVQREMDRSVPSFDFLISINENIAAGLAGEA